MDAAEKRKQRSIADLRSRGIAVLESLPKIETESEATIRGAQEIARRALCLGAVASVAFGSTRRDMREYVAKNRLEHYLSPEERDYLAKSRETKSETIKFHWRIEAAVPLMWALGHLKELSPSAQQVDSEALFNLFPTLEEAGQQFIESAQRRSATEILDFADWIYRAHWAIREARLRPGTPTGQLDGDVVMEWHHAANWLIGYPDGVEWDDVSTDT